MKRSLLNHLGDVHEVTALLVWEWTEDTIPGRKGGEIVTTCNQLEVVFYKKKLFCQSTVFIYGLACVMLSNIHVINALIKLSQERKMKRQIILVWFCFFFKKKLTRLSTDTSPFYARSNEVCGSSDKVFHFQAAHS